MKQPVLCITFIIAILHLVLMDGVLATPIPDTGQTKCYDDTQEITCPNPGEPFYGQDAQYDINAQSYTKLDENGNDLPDDAPWPWAMVRDNVTGLTWEIKTVDGSIHNKNNAYEWWHQLQDRFIASINNDNFGGRSDWRLPTIKELASIINRDTYDPSINTTYFPHTMSDLYWSSNTSGDSPYQALIVNFYYGTVADYGKSYYTFVQAVRAGQCGTFGNYIDNGDRTVTDTVNGLMWQMDTALGTYNWQEALSYCESLVLAEHNDWRLPNANELYSLVDYSSCFPSINTAYFPNTIPYEFWSSTTIASNMSDAWMVKFDYGFVGSDFKSSHIFVRCVRGGQCDSFNDSDNDFVFNCVDSCLSTPNGQNLGTCTKGAFVNACTTDEECGTGGFCSQRQEDTDSDYLGDACDECTDTDKDGYGNPEFIVNTCPDDNCPNTYNPDQLDSYPPQGNHCGDACECEGNFNGDQDVDGSDVATFKADFGRSTFQKPCITSDICNGDFNCDGDVDGTDAALLKQDFGRSSVQNPCPACVVAEWCQYP